MVLRRMEKVVAHVNEAQMPELPGQIKEKGMKRLREGSMQEGVYPL